MKVVVFSRDFPPDHGGVQTWMESIARYHGSNAVVVTRHYPGDKHFDAAQSYQVKRMPRLEWQHQSNILLDKFYRALSLFVRFIVGGIFIADVIRDQKTDVVHCAYAFANGLPMMVVRIMTGCPYVVYCHGTEILREVQAGPMQRLLLKLVMRLAVRVVVNSSFMQMEVGRMIDPKRIIVAELGADSGYLDSQAMPAEEVNGVSFSRRKILLTHGRIERRKGHDKIALVLPKIVEKHPEILWVVVGDGPDREHIQGILKDNGMSDYAIFTGRLSDEELSKILARADLFIMPNRRIGFDVEGFGIVFLEAAKFGVPAIAGKSGGAVDAVIHDETGYHCDSENLADLTKKIDELLTDDNLRKTMGERAKTWAAKRTWANCAAKVESEIAPQVL